jgi:hypothetical protein
VCVLEAMAYGCVPVVSDIESGIPELINDGVTGFRVPVGDIDGFAERLTLLYKNSILRRRMSINAHLAVQEGGYDIESVTNKYITIFERIRSDIETGAFKRPKGDIWLPSFLQVHRETYRSLQKRHNQLKRSKIVVLFNEMRACPFLARLCLKMMDISARLCRLFPNRTPP